MILVTGGAGFIGANFVLDWLAQSDEAVVNLDKLTYAGNPETLASLRDNLKHVFVQGDIGDSALLDRLLAEHKGSASGSSTRSCFIWPAGWSTVSTWRASARPSGAR